MVVMYGIKNCDTIKKARRWLEANHIEYRFHDYRADGLMQIFCITPSMNWAGRHCLTPAVPPGVNWTNPCAPASLMPTARQN